MTNTAIPRECERCHDVLPIVGRGLCSHCYHRSLADGTIHTYSTVSERVARVPLVCDCTKPLVDALILWDAYQCGRCGRRIPDERMKELGE